MNEWISVKDGLPKPGTEVVVAICDESGDTRWKYTTAGWMANETIWIVDNEVHFDVTHWMYFPKYPEEQNKLTLVDNNKMLWIKKEHFRCHCGGNVFNEYKTSNGKRIFECHSCGSKYEGE